MSLGQGQCQTGDSVGAASRGLGSAGREKGQWERPRDITEPDVVAGGVPGWWHRSPWGSAWSPPAPEMPKGRRRPVLSLRLWLSRRSMRPTRMIWHTRYSRSRFRSVLPRSWETGTV